MRFNFKNVDSTKANSNIEREFKPWADQDVVIHYKALTNGDMINMASKDGDINSVELFRKQVTKIDGIIFTFDDGEEKEATADMIINAPLESSNNKLLSLIGLTVNAIIGNSRLTEEEEKNSDSDIDVQEENY